MNGEKRDWNGYASTGREWDAAAQLYYYRARWYDPKSGRFISQDPIGTEGGINLYAYVADNPTNWTDSAGLCPGCSVTVRCRTIDDWRPKFFGHFSFHQTEIVHCYLTGTQPGSVFTFTAGPTEAGTLGAYAATGWPVPGSADSVRDELRMAQPIPCDVLECLKRSSQWFSNQQFRYQPFALGRRTAPNSNSYAAGLAAMCGLNANLPFSAPGRNFFR